MSHIKRQSYVKHEESPRTSAWRTAERKSVTHSAKKRWRAQLPAEWQKPVPSHVTWNVAPGMLSRLKNAKNEQYDKFFKAANQLTPAPKSPRHKNYKPDLRHKANKVKGHLVNVRTGESPQAHRATMRQVSPKSPQSPQFALLQHVAENGYSTNSASSRGSPAPVSNHSTTSRSSRGSPVPFAYAPLSRSDLREPELENTSYLPMKSYLANTPNANLERMIEENMRRQSKQFQENKQKIELAEILKTALPQHRPKELPPLVMRPRLKSAKKESPRPIPLGPVPLGPVKPVSPRPVSVKPASPKGKQIVFKAPDVKPASPKGKQIVFKAPDVKPFAARHAPVSVPLIQLPSPRASQSLSHRSARPSQRQTARAKHANAIQMAMNLYPNAANAANAPSAPSVPSVPNVPSRESVTERIKARIKANRQKATRRVVRTALVPKKVTIKFQSPTRKKL